MNWEAELSTEINRVVVVGAGIMGNGIAQVIASSGMEAVLVDVSKPALDRAQERIERNLDRLTRSERLDKTEAEMVRGRISTSTDLGKAASGADFAIETVIEDLDVKCQVLRELDESLSADVIIGSNTSQFSISTLGAFTSRAPQVIGFHWFNPPPVMDLIEIIRGLETSEATVKASLALAGRCGKTSIICEKDTPGFITSRLIIALGLEAARIVEEGVATAEDVNLACVKAFNHAMGPLDTLDFSGLDTSLHVAENMREQYGDRFLSPQNLRTLVSAKHLGRKTGRGFRRYETPS